MMPAPPRPAGGCSPTPSGDFPGRRMPGQVAGFNGFGRRLRRLFLVVQGDAAERFVPELHQLGYRQNRRLPSTATPTLLVTPCRPQVSASPKVMVGTCWVNPITRLPNLHSQEFDGPDRQP